MKIDNPFKFCEMSKEEQSKLANEEGSEAFPEWLYRAFCVAREDSHLCKLLMSEGKRRKYNFMPNFVKDFYNILFQRLYHIYDTLKTTVEKEKKEDLIEKYFIAKLFETVKADNFSDFFVEVSFELVTNTNRVHRDVPLSMLRSVKHYNSLGKILIDPDHSKKLFKEKKFGCL